jgi:hypothetical protein
MGNFILEFIRQFSSKKTAKASSPPSITKSTPIKVSFVMMPGSNPHAINEFEAAIYLNQWQVYKDDYYEFLNLSKIPANYSDPNNRIYLLRDSLLKYELIDFETFTNNGYLMQLSNILKSTKKFRICNGIKTIDQIQNSKMDEESKKLVIEYLLKNCKDKIECFIIMTFDK